MILCCLLALVDDSIRFVYGFLVVRTVSSKKLKCQILKSLSLSCN